jgi:hypothetical protein
VSGLHIKMSAEFRNSSVVTEGRRPRERLSTRSVNVYHETYKAMVAAPLPGMEPRSVWVEVALDSGHNQAVVISQALRRNGSAERVAS